MYFLLNNSIEKKICWLTDGGEIFEFNSDLGVLNSFDELLKKINIHLVDVSGLAVVVGKGRFTSTRIAVTIANTMAFALSIPVIAVGDSNEKWVENLRANIAGRYISAQYSAEPNIGKNKI